MSCHVGFTVSGFSGFRGWGFREVSGFWVKSLTSFERSGMRLRGFRLSPRPLGAPAGLSAF